MNSHRIERTIAACLWFACAVTLSAQTDMKGHWTGSIVTQGGPLGIEVDLDKTASGWIGSLSMPTRGMVGLPLDPVTFADGKAAFVIKGPPDAPHLPERFQRMARPSKERFPRARSPTP